MTKFLARLFPTTYAAFFAPRVRRPMALTAAQLEAIERAEWELAAAHLKDMEGAHG